MPDEVANGATRFCQTETSAQAQPESHTGTQSPSQTHGRICDKRAPSEQDLMDADPLRHLQQPAKAPSKNDGAIRACVQKTNHVNLVVTPAAASAISRMMEAVGGRYVGIFNARHQRNGPLRKGRFEAALLDTTDT